ncbi:hypothetical protein [Actinomadura napierensis]|uniref:ABC transporter permease n=1 Tax=Actinomadura napierensis TaxID=267854 RepID=A0ABN2YCM4_9ACTN
MIWLTWRQHRRQALFTLAGLAVLAAFIVPTGLAMRHDYTRLGLAGCGSGGPGGACGPNMQEFSSTYGSLVFVSVLMLVVPLLVGVFWGAPVIAREVEQGTHRMIWTQGISRRRWALVKIGLLGGTVTVLATLYGLGMAWWYVPLAHIDTRQNRFTEVFFDMQGVVPIGYTLLAVALGILISTMLPKALPAMAVTLAGFIAVRFTLAFFARPRYMTPASADYPVQGGSVGPAQGWVLSSSVHRADGTFVMSGAIKCPPNNACAPELGLRPGAYNHQVFHPADRFWAFQWIETGICLALAALLVWYAVHRIRRIG